MSGSSLFYEESWRVYKLMPSPIALTEKNAEQVHSQAVPIASETNLRFSYVCFPTTIYQMKGSMQQHAPLINALSPTSITQIVVKLRLILK